MNEGRSIESFGALIGVNRDTLYEWEKNHSDFAHAKSVGELKSLAWWENIMRGGMMKKGFNGTICIYNMKCRFAKYGYNPKSTDGGDPGDDFEFV